MATGGTSRPALWAVTLGAAVVSIAFQGFEFPFGNNVFHVPIALDFAGSTQGPHDAFHQSLGDYFSLFWLGVGWVVAPSNIFEVLLALHTLTRAAILALLWRLADEIRGTPSKLHGLVCVLALSPAMLGHSPVGRSELLLGYFSHSEVALALVLGSWLLGLRRRLLWASVVAGLAFNVNAFYGAWAAGAIAVLFWLTARGPSRSAWSKRLAKLVAGWSLAVAPTAAWIVASLAGGSGVDFDYRAYLRDYYPNHFFIDVAVGRDLIVVAIAGIVAAAIVHQLRDATSLGDATSLPGSLLMYLAGLLALGAALPYLTDARLLLNLQLLRVDALIILLAATLVVAQLTREPSAGAFGFVALLGLVVGHWLVVAAAVCFQHARPRSTQTSTARSWLAAGVLAALAGAVVLVGTAPGPGPTPRAATLATIGAIGVLGAGTGLRAAKASALAVLLVAVVLGDAAVAAAVLAVSAIVVVTPRLSPARGDHPARSGTRSDGSGGVWFAVALLVIAAAGIARAAQIWPVGLYLVAVATMAWSAPIHRRRDLFQSPRRAAVVVAAVALIPVGPALASRLERGSLSNAGPDAAAWRELQRWAQRHTPRDSVFMVPPNRSGFSLTSRRSVWVDWKSGAAVMWRPDYFHTWAPRLAEQRQLDTPAQRADYCRRQGIDYVVVETDETRDPSDTMVFRNTHFAVIEPVTAIER